MKTNLDLFFEIIEKLYNVEDLDQQQIDKMLIAFMEYGDKKTMIYQEWHGSEFDYDSPLRQFLDSLNCNAINRRYAKLKFEEFLETEPIDELEDEGSLENEER